MGRFTASFILKLFIIGLLVFSAAPYVVTGVSAACTDPNGTWQDGQGYCDLGTSEMAICTGGTMTRTPCAAPSTCAVAANVPTCTAAAAPAGNVTSATLIPQAGVNCGIPIEDRLPGDPDVNPADPRHACCYSAIPDSLTIPTDTDWVPGVSGLNSIMNAIVGGANSLIDNMPFFVTMLGPINALPIPSMGKFKAALRSIPACFEGNAVGGAPGDAACKCSKGGSPSLYSLAKYCQNIIDPVEVGECTTCVTGYTTGTGFGGGGVWTGLGCIKVSEGSFIQSLMSIGLGIAGGFALLCIMYSAFVIQTSRGDTERIKHGRDMLTACITGLLIIIFSVFILKFIGYDILNLPGFGT